MELIIVRGGSRNAAETTAHSSFRYGYIPIINYNFIGFRIATRKKSPQIFRGGTHRMGVSPVRAAQRRFGSRGARLYFRLGFRLARRKK